MYVIRKSEPNVWTVGSWQPASSSARPNGARDATVVEWVAESDQPNETMAAARVHYLNGGNSPHW